MLENKEKLKTSFTMSVSRYLKMVAAFVQNDQHSDMAGDVVCHTTRAQLSCTLGVTEMDCWLK